MGMLKEFKDFAVKGNVVDLAIGVVIGGAFGAIIASLVDDIIMPLLNPLMPEGGWQTMMVGPMSVGKFLGAIVKFLIIAMALFMVVKGMNKMKKAEPPAPPAEPSSTDKLLAEIRDSLKK